MRFLIAPTAVHRGSLSAARRMLLFALLIAVVRWPVIARADDWPHWRGPSRNDIVASSSGWDGQNWISSKPLWTAQVGEGASSPLLVKGQVFTLGHGNGQDVVSCLEATTGKLVWSVSVPARRYGRNATGDEGLYSGPSSTPEFDPETGYLYTLGSDGDLFCRDTTQRGATVWQRNLYDDYAMPQRPRVGRSGRRDYGYTAAPLIYRDWLLVEAGGPKGTIVAFERKTGREAWRSQATDPAGHTGGPALMTVENVPCLATLTFAGLLVIRLDEGHAGETVATWPWVTDFANNIAGPAVFGDSVLITSEYNQSALCRLKITLRGAEQVWKVPHASKACTPVIHDGKIYIAWDRLRCLDWSSGRLLREGSSVGDAGSCVLTSDRKLIVWCGRGDLLLIEADDSSDRAGKELAAVRRLAADDVWPHVVVADGRILCRDRHGHLLCFTRPADPR